jgi:hypothetical protein
MRESHGVLPRGSSQEPVVFCPTDRVINLFNQAHPDTKPAVRVSEKVRNWFGMEALNAGWVACRFVLDVQTKHGAGAILMRPNLTVIDGQRITIVIPEGQ